MKYDAHVHLNTLNEPFMDHMVENQRRFLTIITETPDFPSIEEQFSIVQGIRHRYPGVVNFATTFSCHGWGSDGWLTRSLDMIKRSVDAGAVGVKIWKNIGMDLKDREGQYVTVDHPSFEPIFQFLEENGIVLLGHNGEPRNCWLPLEEMTVQSDKKYFESHPEFHMYLHPEQNSYEDHLLARNRMLKKFPDLRFVGLHLASQEWSVAEVAKFLDEFPNTMVDLAERICHLQYQAIHNWQGVHNFFITYQDRIIYGSDLIVDDHWSNDDLRSCVREKYASHDQFFRGDKWMTVPKVLGTFRGLGLPEEVVKKVYSTNALATYRFSSSRRGVLFNEK